MFYTSIVPVADVYKNFCKDTHFGEVAVICEKNLCDKAWRDFQSLFKTLDAAGGIVKNAEGKYLFIRRLDKWDLPKGKIEKGEKTQKAAIREVQEETGLKKVEITKQMPSTFHIYKDKNGRQVLKETYWYEMFATANEPLVPQLEENITEVRWFAENELYIPLHDTYLSLEYLLKVYFNL